MNDKIEKLSYNWLTLKSDKVDTTSDYYCGTRDVFQTRLDRMTNNLLINSNINEEKVYLISAILGEIGNNSFDHNLGKWPDVIGIFFAYNLMNNKLKVVLADRGQGVLRTLKRVKPELKNNSEALKTAFTEKISGRMPENRGNGLKFVKKIIEKENMNLVFTSGNAQAKLNKEMEIRQIKNDIRGCLTFLTV